MLLEISRRSHQNHRCLSYFFAQARIRQVTAMDRDINPFFDQIRRPVEIQQFHRNVGIAIEKLLHSGHDVKV